MKQKTLIVMASCGAILTLLGLSLDSGRDSRSAWSRASEPIFPNLPAQVDTADTLVIESAMGTTTLTRSGDDWTVVEKGGFPGRGDEVGRLLVALAEASRVEPLTSKPGLHGQLGLGGFEDEASPTVRLTAKAGSDVLADIFIGNRRTQGVGEGWYVLHPGDDQAWAAQAKLRCPRQTSEWLQTEVMDIARDRIAHVSLESPAGEALHLERQGPSGAGFDIQNLPQGREPKTAASAAGFLGSLAGLRITDVQSEAESGFPEEGTSSTTWRTRGGLWIRAELAEQTEDKLLARFTFGYDAEASPQQALGPVPAPEEGEQDPLPTPAELQAEAGALNSATKGWIFTLPTWKKASFVTTMEELLNPLVDETDAPEPDISVPVPAQETPVIEMPIPEEVEVPEEVLEAEVLEAEVLDEEVLVEEVLEAEAESEEGLVEDVLEDGEADGDGC
jgi:hypothetical protein